MDRALACCAGGLGSIPDVGMVGSSCNTKIIFVPLWSKVVIMVNNGTRHNNWCDLAFPECREKKNPRRAISGRT